MNNEEIDQNNHDEEIQGNGVKNQSAKQILMTENNTENIENKDMIDIKIYPIKPTCSFCKISEKFLKNCCECSQINCDKCMQDSKCKICSYDDKKNKK